MYVGEKDYSGQYLTIEVRKNSSVVYASVLATKKIGVKV